MTLLDVCHLAGPISMIAPPPPLFSRFTYSGHQKSVFAVELVENMDSIVSCDGAVHVRSQHTHTHT